MTAMTDKLLARMNALFAKSVAAGAAEAARVAGLITR